MVRSKSKIMLSSFNKTDNSDDTVLFCVFKPLTCLSCVRTKLVSLYVYDTIFKQLLLRFRKIIIKKILSFKASPDGPPLKNTRHNIMNIRSFSRHLGRGFVIISLKDGNFYTQSNCLLVPVVTRVAHTAVSPVY